MAPIITTLHLTHLPSELAIHVALCRNLENAAFLRQQLLDGNPEFEYAFLDASTILSPTHILAAVFRAVNDHRNKRMKSRNVHSEVVFSLSPNNNIAAAFRTFGISDTTKDLLILRLATSPSITLQSVSEHLGTAVQGQWVEFSADTLASSSDLVKIRKIYKLQDTSKKGTKEELGRAEIEMQILGLMALRGAS